MFRRSIFDSLAPAAALNRASPSRRRLLLGGLLALGAAPLGEGLAGCAPARRGAARFSALDASRLETGFVGLAAQVRPGLLNLAVAEVGAPGLWAADPRGRYPLGGAAKLPIAAAVLARVDAGALRLNTPVRVRREDLSVPPSRLNLHLLRRGAPPDLVLPLADLIALAIQHDDATASDVTLKLIGGPGAATDFLAGAGLAGIRIDRYARESLCDLFQTGPFQPDWASPEGWARAQDARAPAVRQAAMDAYLADDRDTANAPTAVAFLVKLASGGLLSPTSTAFLLSLMTDSEPRSGLAGGLPGGTSLARKAGTTPTDLGFTAADNVLAIAGLPGGPRLAIAAFQIGSTATRAQRAAIFDRAGALIAQSMSPPGARAAAR
jgi:beta-lactamase class A